MPGRVVYFRASEYLRSLRDNESVPLIHPINLQMGYIVSMSLTFDLPGYDPS